MIKNFLLALLFSCLSTHLIIMSSALTSQDDLTYKFTDIESNAWYLSPIFRLYKLGGVSGYNDNTFRPNKTITRAEFLALLLASNDNRQESNEYIWYLNYQLRAFQLDLICPTDNFCLDQKITRLEMATLICKFLNLDTQISNNQIFDDVRPNFDNRKYMDTVYKNKLIKGYVEGPLRLFRPISNLTRAEASTVVINVYDYKNDKDAFLQGSSVSSKMFETDKFYAFNTRIIGKNSNLFNISKINSRRYQEAFNIIVHLKRKDEFKDEFKLNVNHHKKQIEECKDILIQKFSEEKISEITKYMNQKQKPAVSLELKKFESGINNNYKASVSSNYYDSFIALTIWNEN